MSTPRSRRSSRARSRRRPTSVCGSTRRTTTRVQPAPPSSACSSSAVSRASASSSATTSGAWSGPSGSNSWVRGDSAVASTHPQRPRTSSRARPEHGRVPRPLGSSASARAQFQRVVDGLEARFPAVAGVLIGAEADVLVCFTFSASHRRQIRSTGPLGHLNKEIKRRTAAVGIFTNRASLIRLVGWSSPSRTRGRTVATTSDRRRSRRLMPSSTARRWAQRC